MSPRNFQLTSLTDSLQGVSMTLSGYLILLKNLPSNITLRRTKWKKCFLTIRVTVLWKQDIAQEKMCMPQAVKQM